MASPDGTNDSADRNDAPSTIAVDVGQAADGHGSTEVDVGGANASSSAARHPSAARLYPLFNGRTAGSGRRNGSTGELFPDGCGRISSGCLAGRLKNRGSCRARPRHPASGWDHRGSCLARPRPPASTPGSRNRGNGSGLDSRPRHSHLHRWLRRRHLRRWTRPDVRPSRHPRGNGSSCRQPLHEYRAWYPD